MLKRLLYLELVNEKLKNELALHHDFDPEEAFRILDRTGRGELRSYDLIQALETQFGKNSFTIREIDLFMMRYDKIEGKRLKLGDFVEQVINPREQVFAEYYKRK
jgi:Ca2+-binding EF-hand superfamily protein